MGKYEMQPISCKIKVVNFLDAVEEIGLKLTQKEKVAIEKQFDPLNTGILDLSPIIRADQTSGVKLGVLPPDKEHSLKDLQKEMHNYLVEENINLLELM